MKVLLKVLKCTIAILARVTRIRPHAKATLVVRGLEVERSPDTSNIQVIVSVKGGTKDDTEPDSVSNLPGNSAK